RLRTGVEVVLQIGAHPRAVRSGGKRRGRSGEQEREHESETGTHWGVSVLRRRVVRLRLWPPNVVHRVEQYSLRAADRSNRLQPSFANPVVDRAPRHSEQLGGMVQRDASADTRFEAGSVV